MIKAKIKKILKINQYRQMFFYAKMINKNDLCFDIGANVGTKSRVFLSLGAKVVAFEPQPQCFKYLADLKSKKIKFLPYGIGANNEKKELQLTTEIEIASFSKSFINYVESNVVKKENSILVTVKKLDTVIEEFGIPDYCKIDVEGYELEILSNLNYVIPLIEFEFTGALLNDTFKIITLLKKRNTLYNFNLNEKSHFELSNWVTAEEIIICIKKMPINKLHGNIFVKNRLS